MLPKQQAVEFAFEAILSNVEDWVNINPSHSHEGYYDQYGRYHELACSDINRDATFECVDEKLAEEDQGAEATRPAEKFQRRPDKEDFDAKVQSHWIGSDDVPSTADARSTLVEQQIKAQHLSDARQRLASVIESLPEFLEHRRAEPILDRLVGAVTLLDEELRPGKAATHHSTNERRTELRKHDDKVTPENVDDTSDSDAADSVVSEALLDVPAQVNTFFSHARRANVLMERIAEMRNVEAERLGRAGFEPATNAPLQEDAACAGLRLLEAAYIDAKKRVEEERRECIAQGIDPEVFRYRRFSNDSH